MIHAKFRGNRPAGSGEQYFLRVFNIYMGVSAILVMRLAGEHTLIRKTLKHPTLSICNQKY